MPQHDAGSAAAGQSMVNALTPGIVALPPGCELLDVALGKNHTCFLVENPKGKGDVYTCGLNTCGQLGNGVKSETADGQFELVQVRAAFT